MQARIIIDPPKTRAYAAFPPNKYFTIGPENSALKIWGSVIKKLKIPIMIPI
jgi:hypothetical protein